MPRSNDLSRGGGRVTSLLKASALIGVFGAYFSAGKVARADDVAPDTAASIADAPLPNGDIASMDVTSKSAKNSVSPGLLVSLSSIFPTLPPLPIPFSVSRVDACTELRKRVDRERCLGAYVDDLETLVQPYDIGLPDAVASHGAIIEYHNAYQQARRAVETAIDRARREPSGVTAADVETAISTLEVSMERLIAGLDSLRRDIDHRFLTSPVLTLGGGTGEGSFQAGFLYLYTTFLLDRSRHFRAVRDPSSLARETSDTYRVITGASVGGVNAFLAAMSGCLKPIERPEKSPFFRAWIPRPPLGESGFYNPAAVTAVSLLTKEPIDDAVARVIADHWKSGDGWTSAACGIDFGIPLTRLENRAVAVDGTDGVEEGDDLQIRVPQQIERFAFRLEKGTGDAPPKIFNRRPVTKGDAEGDRVMDRLYPRLLEQGDRSVYLDHVAALLKASTAVPGLFAPVSVPHVIYDRQDTPVSSKGLFVDGALFDSAAEALAVRLTRWRQWQSEREGEVFRTPVPFIAFDPGVEGWERCTEESPAGCDASASPAKTGEDGGRASVPSAQGELDNLFPFAADFARQRIASTGRGALLSAIETAADGKGTPGAEHLAIATRRFPTASGQYHRLLGFFESDFREFDFYLGMAEAEAFIASDHPMVLERLTSEGAATRIDSPLFTCVADFASQTKGFSDAAVDPLDVPSCCRYRCGGETDRGCRGRRPLCPASASSGEGIEVEPEMKRQNMIALLRASLAFKQWTRRPAYRAAQQGEKWLTLLAANDYVYRDFGDTAPIEADVAMRRFRDILQRSAREMARAQEAIPQKACVSVVGQLGTGHFGYLEARYTVELSVHADRGVEIGFGVAPFGSEWLRLRLASRVYQIGAHYVGPSGGAHSGVTLMPLALQLVLTPSRNRFLQLEPFIGGGVSFPVTKRGWVAYRPFIEGGLTLVLLQRIYLTGGPTVYVDRCKNDRDCDNLFPDYAGATHAPFRRQVGVNVSLGARAWW